MSFCELYYLPAPTGPSNLYSWSYGAKHGVLVRSLTLSYVIYILTTNLIKLNQEIVPEI